MSVLSIRVGLTVWCRDRVIWWQAADGRYEQRVPTDLVETAGRIVCTCEEMDSISSGRGGADGAHMPGPLSGPGTPAVVW
jgi:hypothetical protein